MGTIAIVNRDRLRRALDYIKQYRKEELEKLKIELDEEVAHDMLAMTMVLRDAGEGYKESRRIASCYFDLEDDVRDYYRKVIAAYDRWSKMRMIDPILR